MTPTEIAMLQALMKELASDIHLDEVNIRQREESLSRKRIAYAVIEEKFKAAVAEQQAKNPFVDQEPVPVRRRFTLETRPARKPDPPLFLEAFRKAVNSLAEQEIYVAPVFDAMVKLGLQVLDERKARLRVGTELARLEEKGTLTKIHQGGGNVPSRYKLVAAIPLTSEGDASDLV